MSFDGENEGLRKIVMPASVHVDIRDARMHYILMNPSDASTPQSISQILQPAIDALISVGLVSRATSVRQAISAHEAFEQLEAAYQAIWDIRDHDRHLEALPDLDGCERAMPMEDYRTLHDVHRIVIAARIAVATRREA
jgi:hypothetical protein